MINFLTTKQLKNTIKKADIQYINCKHGTVSDPNDAQLYLQGVQKLIGQTKITDYPYPWDRKIVK